MWKRKMQGKFWISGLYQGLQTYLVIAVENEPLKYTLPGPAYPGTI